MSARRHIGNPEYLTRRIPQNPRYQHVKSRLDTDYRYKKDELFKRLKVTTFAQLVIQVASLSDQTLEVTAEEIQRLEDNDSATSEADAEIAAKTNGKGSPEEQSPSPVQFINSTGAGDSSRSTLQSVISGVGELDVDKGLVKKEEPNGKDKPYPDCPFLLLDVRDRDSYQQCHIVGAYSYPIATLSRTMNPYSNDILEYKNAHGKIIILYDEDERLASQAATTMCERGFENLFMLSGGLKVLAQKFPEGLVTGSLPASCQQALPFGSVRKRRGPKMPALPAENKWRFTPEDLKKIECYLEEDQGPADNPSRLNQNNSAGKDSKVAACRGGQNLPTSCPASHSSPRTLTSGHLQGKPWK
ncbi:centrosomal protein of 41 kDa isoform X7 [Mus musculus]|uniref:centrosomal protein of 41 kDa isoform X7 n=1 Tax=Mus musculus TaxID=10090 RepID=UPI0000479012|nr:centrosomal protein of 41 kDa isoform X7 [Mus musculus]|eukprot:XP_006505274.1 PREDICTED: centrosomal protein of 41 kDa isoform X6 [Mus musculus]